MTDQNTRSTVSTLVDHVAATDTVVARLAQHPQIQFHHTDGGQGVVPRYIADEIGQAVLALVPDEGAELAPEQYALLDALRDVAQTSDAPGATYATEQIARLAGEAFGYPLPPAEVVRRGGFADLFLGRPVRVDQLATGGPISAPARRHPTGEGLGAEPLAVVVDELHQPDAAEPEAWPFKPGTVVRDEDGAEDEWLDAAPVRTVVRTPNGYEWVRLGTGRWAHNASLATSTSLARQAPVTVVSVPDPQEACTDDAPAGDA